MGKHRSGHSYQEFPILNVARRCGLVLNDRTLEWEEVEASCPFCGDHGPGKHHLFLNTTRNIFRCVLCGEKGNSVSLYAKMEGVSNRQAFRALSEDSVLYRFPQQPLSQKPAEREPSSLAVRHNVYYDMLMHLELSPKHKADLLARGLSEERIEQNMYRTLPMSSSARRFLAGILSDFHNLEGVPGFYVDRGYWNILGHSGLLVPCRDRNGYIQGLQIRLDDETKPDRKYRWLSSRGKAHGTRSYSYIHVTGNIHARTAYLTEGGLKGDVASFLDHDALFLCFAGVTAIAGLKDALQSMENLEEVVVALDMDKLVNWRVRNALGKILETVQSIPNLRVRLMTRRFLAGILSDFHNLEGVPGFYVDRGYWNILGHSGLLVPCRDRNGYIQGLQIRLDDETKPDRKYRWLSSRGKAHGTRSYSYIHVTGNIHARTAYLTEGGLKGDVASFLDHDALFLCFAGVTAIAGLKDALQSMENLEEVVVALDMDKLVNWRVRNALGKILETVQSIPNLRVRLMNWNMTFKGVDDFYKARNEAASKGVNILDMTSNFITMRLESLWKQEYPEQDRGFIHTCEWEELTVPIDQLTAGKPADMKKAQYYLKLLWAGKVDFPPLVSVNGVVIDGLHRFWAYQQMGYQTVTVYQNKPWAMPTAA